MFNNLSVIEAIVVGLTTENNEDVKKKKEEVDVQKDSTLWPITKTNSKLDKELQEWEVDSTHSAGWLWGRR